jgi:hypothetical protein
MDQDDSAVTDGVVGSDATVPTVEDALFTSAEFMGFFYNNDALILGGFASNDCSYGTSLLKNNNLGVKTEIIAKDECQPQPESSISLEPLSVQAEENILLQVYTRATIYGWTVKEARENRRKFPGLARGIKSIRRRESTRLASIKCRAKRKAELEMLRREQRQRNMGGHGPR